MIRYGSKVVVLLVGLIAVTSVVALAAGFGVAAPAALGSGPATVSAPPVQVTNIGSYTLQPGNPTLFRSVDVTLQHVPTTSDGFFDVYVVIKGSGVALGSRSFQQQFVNGTGVTFMPTFGVGDNILVSAVDEIAVTVCNSPAPPTPPQPINTCQ